MEDINKNPELQKETIQSYFEREVDKTPTNAVEAKARLLKIDDILDGYIDLGLLR